VDVSRALAAVVMAEEMLQRPNSLPFLSLEILRAVLTSLPTAEAFRFSSVARAYLAADCRRLLLRRRPEAWMPEALDSESLKDPNFCQQLKKEWHQCLYNSPVQVVTYLVCVVC